MEKLEIEHYPIGTKVYCLEANNIRWFQIQKMMVVLTKVKVHIDENGQEVYADNVSDNIDHIVQIMKIRDQ